jgi:hypothetical protein
MTICGMRIPLLLVLALWTFPGGKLVSDLRDQSETQEVLNHLSVSCP